MSELLDFARGQLDCAQGVPHAAGQSAAYDSGYSFEYQMGEIFTHNNEEKENVINS